MFSVLETLSNAPFPTLTIVDGPAYGAGGGLAAASDLCWATARATFGFPECGSASRPLSWARLFFAPSGAAPWSSCSPPEPLCPHSAH